jgi:hypothetical protein
MTRRSNEHDCRSIAGLLVRVSQSDSLVDGLPAEIYKIDTSFMHGLGLFEVYNCNIQGLGGAAIGGPGGRCRAGALVYGVTAPSSRLAIPSRLRTK